MIIIIINVYVNCIIISYCCMQFGFINLAVMTGECFTFLQMWNRRYSLNNHVHELFFIDELISGLFCQAIRELSIKKHHLLLELKNYDASGAMKSSTGSTTTDPSSRSRQREAGAIPVSFIYLFMQMCMNWCSTG